METYNNAASIARISSAMHPILKNMCAYTYERLSLQEMCSVYLQHPVKLQLI